MLSSDGGCFVCGRDNPGGLQLEFTYSADGRTAETIFAPSRQYQGWAGIAHGGILMTVLDEVMAKAAVHGGLQIVTGEMTVKLRTPAQIDEPLTFRGSVKEVKKRIVYAEAAAARPDGTIVAEAAAKMFIIEA